MEEVKKPYWHSIGNTTFAEVMMHNTQLRKGILPTGDAMRPFLHEGMLLSPYSHFTSEREKEQVWEKVRKEKFPHLPSRHECLFLFDSKNDLEAAHLLWWPNESRRVLIALIMPGSVSHKADTRWLNATREDWEKNAISYWSGAATSEPLFELVVQGTVFFPEWEAFPSLLPSDHQLKSA